MAGRKCNVLLAKEVRFSIAKWYAARYFFHTHVTLVTAVFTQAPFLQLNCNHARFIHDFFTFISLSYGGKGLEFNLPQTNNNNHIGLRETKPGKTTFTSPTLTHDDQIHASRLQKIEDLNASFRLPESGI